MPDPTPAPKPVPRAALPAGPATENAPSVTLPLRFILVGMLAWFTAAALLIARPELLSTYHYNQHIIAVTHLVVLGFVLSVVVGAMFQLVPVALETRLYSERLGRWQFPLQTIGAVGMVVTFWIWNLQEVGHFGSLLAVAIGLFIVNLARTLRRAPRRDTVWLGIASVLAWLGFTILTGLYLASTKCWAFSPFATIPAMHAHAHVGVLGVFLLLIITVSYKLVPMFVLSRIQNERRARASIHLFNLGLAGLFITVLLAQPAKLAFALVLVAALALFGLELRAILRARLRRQLDWGMLTFLAGLALLIPLSLLAVALCWPGLPATLFTTQLENAYGLLGLLGVIGLAIMGMLHKIAPFLVWYHAYSSRVGYEPVPALSDLYSHRIQILSASSYSLGLLVATVGTTLSHAGVVRAGCGILALGLSLLALNLTFMLSHWFRQRHTPAARPSPSWTQPVSRPAS
jgi:hypothetical protein